MTVFQRVMPPYEYYTSSPLLVNHFTINEPPANV